MNTIRKRYAGLVLLAATAAVMLLAVIVAGGGRDGQMTASAATNGYLIRFDYVLLKQHTSGSPYMTTGSATSLQYGNYKKRNVELRISDGSGGGDMGTAAIGKCLNFGNVNIYVDLLTDTSRQYSIITRYSLVSTTGRTIVNSSIGSSITTTLSNTVYAGALSDGTYNLTVDVKAHDFFASYPNNTATTESITLTTSFSIDTAPPAITGASRSESGTYTNTTFSVKADDGVSGVKKLYMSTPTDGAFRQVGGTSVTVMNNATNGRYAFYAEDNAGNTSPTYYTTLDTVVPTGKISGTGENLGGGGATNKSFAYSATDTGSGINKLQYRQPNSSTWITAFGEIHIGGVMGDGLYVFRAMDRAGNYSSESSVLLDTTSPAGTLHAGGNTVTSGSGVNTDMISFRASDTLSGVGKIYVRMPGAGGYTTMVNNASFTKNGEYSFYCTDNAGNTSKTYTITLDNAAPTLECEGATLGGISGQGFTVTAKDNLGSARLYVKYEGGAWESTGDSYTVPVTSRDGKYYFYAEDDMGNESETQWVLLSAAALEGEFVRSDTDNGVYFTWDAEYLTATMDGKPYTKGTWVRSEGEHTFVLSNGAGKTATYIVTVGHDYRLGRTIAASCTSRGYTEYACSVCGATKRDDYTEMKDHDFVTTGVAASCTEQGYTLHKCTGCDLERITDFIEAKGHDYEESMLPPTCTESSKKVYTCKACGYEQTEHGELPSGHVYVSGIVRAAGCTTEGERHYKCEKCGDEYTSAIPATGHTYAISAVDTTNGKTERKYTCTTCGDSYVQDLGDQNEYVVSYVEYLFELYSPYMVWVFLGTAGVWSIVLGVMIILAHKSEDKEKAKRMIVNYVIGLVVIFAILVACPYLVKGIAALVG